MSRINEAMQRAGQSSSDSDAGAVDETTFTSSEQVPGGLQPHEDEAADAEADEAALAPEAVGLPPIRVSGQRAVARIPPPVIELARHSGRDEVAIRDVIRMLLARWKLIVAILAMSVGAAAVHNARAIPIYQATARLVIEPDAKQIVQSTVQEDTYRGDYFGTQLDILRSRQLARQTLQRLGALGADQARQEAQVGQLAGSLTVLPAKRDVANRTVNVSVMSADPKYAARMANGVAETYIEQNLELKRQGNRDAAKWLTERLGELRHEMTSTAGALQQYREQKDAVSLDDKQNIVGAELNQLNAQVTAVRADKFEKQATYEQLVALKERGSPLDTFPAISNNTFIQAQKSELATLLRNRRQMSEQLGDLHPDMQKIDAEITVAERRLSDEIDKAAESIRNEYQNAKAREESLTSALEHSKRQVMSLDQKKIAYGALQRDASSSQQIFETVLQRLKEAELSAELQTNNVRILDGALEPGVPVFPRTRLNFTIAVLVGLVLGLGLAIALEYLNPRITDAQDVAESLGVAVLGVAPRVPALRKGRLRIDGLPPAFQEAIRTIRTRILLSAAHRDMKTFAVTSTMPKEGKTVVAASLAASMALTGRRVLLVDADLHRAQVHKVFGTRESPGLANILSGAAKPSDALVESSIRGLFLMPAGDHSGPSDLIDTEAVRRLVDGLSQVFDIVVLDCPPTMALADASIVANVADSVLFVVGSGRTNAESARAAIDRLVSVQAQIVGVVLNDAKIGRRSTYGYADYQVEGAV